MNPSFVKILVFWLVKYIVFYLFMMFKTGNYAFVKINEIKNGEDLFYYLFLFLFLPIVSMLIFILPMYFSFKVTRFVYFALILGAIIIVEYFIYTSLASQGNLMNGIYNGLITILVLLLFFLSRVSTLYKGNS